MSYKENIIEELNKTNLKKNSILLYSTRLNNLYKDLNGVNNTNDHLNNTKKVIKYINNIDNLETRVAYFNAICKILEDSDIKNFYIAERKHNNIEKLNKYKNNVKKDNFTEYKKLLEVSPVPDFKQDVKTVLYDFLLYMSVKYPIRLALWDMEVITNKKNLNKDINYLYISSKKMTILMNTFKNINSMGPQEIEIENIDKPVIKEYIKFIRKHLKVQGETLERLLYNFYDGKIIQISSSIIYGRILSRMLKKKLDIHLTMNDIRKSYETHIIQDDNYKNLTNGEKDKLHNKILHTHQSAIMYYNKV